MDFDQNQFFYDSSEGLLTATILILAEFGQKDKRHIVSVFKLIQDLMAPSGTKSSEFKELLNQLPENHKARWFAGAALNTSDQSMQSIMSTALAVLIHLLILSLNKSYASALILRLRRFVIKNLLSF